ncbi:MAG: GNAT family N-acetyltransferase [Candidatus Eisenbacteria bacterium]
MEIHSYRAADHNQLVALINDPAIVDQFEKIAGPNGVRDLLSEPVTHPEGIMLARLDGVPAGFSIAYVLPQASGGFGMQRVGVLQPFRRQGIGLALLRASEHFLLTQQKVAGLDEAGLSAWVPNEGAEALAARADYVHQRYYWLMERPRTVPLAPQWPANIALERFDSSDRHLRGWTDSYNDSFARHHLFLPSTYERARALAERDKFRADGLLLAYQDEVCVGFCRNELFPSRGEIGTLGTIAAARGAGLGRALLRWGIEWLMANTDQPVTLIVDGENEGALRLYEQEGFQIARTRRIWTRPLLRL